MTSKQKTAGALLALATGVLAAALASAASRGGAADAFVLYATAEDGFGVRAGSIVKVRGVPVGRVTGVALAHDPLHPGAPVRLALRISDHGASFLNDKTVARIERIQMGPGIPPFASPEIALESAGDRPLAAGAVLDAAGDSTMVESLVGMRQDMAKLRGTIEELSGFFTALKALTAKVQGGEGAIGKLVADEQLADDIGEIVREVRATSREMRLLVGDARGLSSATAPAIEDVRRMTKEGSKTLHEAGVAAGELPAILAATSRTLAVAEELARDLRDASRYAPELARKADASIEEAHRVLDAAERSVVLRGTLPERRRVRTAAEARPQAGDAPSAIRAPAPSPAASPSRAIQAASRDSVAP